MTTPKPTKFIVGDVHYDETDSQYIVSEDNPEDIRRATEEMCKKYFPGVYDHDW